MINITYILDIITALIIVNKLGKTIYRAGFTLGYKIGRTMREKGRELY